MFRKLVSNLPYSPALIADIGFYASRLRDEDVTRRTTIVFVTLALIIQSLAVFSPPESANASSEQDIIRGGVSNLNDFLLRYDNNEQDVKDIFSTAGLTRSEIAAAREGMIGPANDTYVMSRYGQLGPSGKEVSMAYQRSAGGMDVRYFSPMSSVATANAKFKGWIGKSAALGWFAILQSSGSLATKGLPTTIDPTDSTATNAVKAVNAINLSQGVSDIEKTPAKTGDKVTYTLKLSNPRNVTVTGTFTVRIDDVLEYSTLIDGGGGTLDSKTSTLSWPQIELGPGESQSRTFATQMLASFPATATGKSNPASYDCHMALSFGNQLKAPVDCPPVKSLEGVFVTMPPIGTGINITFGVVILSTALFFYIRTRQLKKEIRIIRHNFNSGVL